MVLTWSPPTLVNAVTITSSGTGSVVIDLDSYPNGSDFLINFPASKRTGTTRIYSSGLNKPRHIKIVGGYLTTSVDDGVVLSVESATGTVHIEGLLIDGSGGAATMNAITFSLEPSTGIAQVQNCRILGVLGTQLGFHGNIIQMYAGKELRVDKLTGDSNFQGFYVRPNQLNATPVPDLLNVDLRRVNLSYNATVGDATSYLLWLQSPNAAGTNLPTAINLDTFYIAPRAAQTVATNAVQPNSAHATLAAVEAGGEITWPTITQMSAASKIISGTPAVDFVPAGSVGLAYANTEGYLIQATHTIIPISTGSRQTEVGICSDSQVSTSTTAAIAGSRSVLDARGWQKLAYTVKVQTAAVTWSVWAANNSNFSDEVVIQNPASVASGAAGTYVIEYPPYSYYRVKIVDTVGGTHGTASVYGITKP